MRGERVWAEIDLEAVRHNLRAVAAAARPAGVMAVVKADAYGHGAVPVAYAAVEAGCSILGVGDSAEALELRDRGVLCRLVILGAIIEEEIPRVVENDIEVTIHSPDLLKHLNREARRRGRLLGVHLKIDTGMRRLGASPESAARILRALAACRHIRLLGVCTHMSTVSGGDLSYARDQLSLFQRTIGVFREQGLLPTKGPQLHAANSAAVFHLRESHLDLVRTGIALYGTLPGRMRALRGILRPAMSLRTRIAFLKQVPAGSAVGYEQTYRTQRPALLATCPAGYNDGYPYALSNRGEALVRGRRVPVVGTVTMDYLVLDVTEVPGVRTGDVVTLIGRDGSAELPVEEVAERAGTIPYEITCRLGRRVRRVYTDAGAPDRATDTRIRPPRATPSLAG